MTTTQLRRRVRRLRRAAAAARRRPTTFSVATELRRQASRPAHPDRARLHGGAAADHPRRVRVRRRRRRRGNGGGAFSSLVDLATAGGANFALFTLLVSSSFLLVVVVALFFGDTVASEASWGSLRYLLAIPVPRARLLGVKLVVVDAVRRRSRSLLLVGTALVAGTLRYGWDPLRSTIADQLEPWPALVRIGGATATSRSSLLVVASLAFLLSVSTDAPLGAVGGAVLLHDPVQHPRPDRGARHDPQLPADPLQRRLGRPAVHARPVRQHDPWHDLGRSRYAAIFFGLAFWRFPARTSCPSSAANTVPCGRCLDLTAMPRSNTTAEHPDR